MATIPTEPMQDGPDEMDPGAAMPMGGDGGFTVCIRVDGSGAFSVGVQQGSYAAEDDASTFTPAGTKKEALTLALELLNNGGKSPVPEDEQAFQDGFASRGQPA